MHKNTKESGCPLRPDSPVGGALLRVQSSNNLNREFPAGWGKIRVHVPDSARGNPRPPDPSPVSGKMPQHETGPADQRTNGLFANRWDPHVSVRATPSYLVHDLSSALVKIKETSTRRVTPCHANIVLHLISFRRSPSPPRPSSPPDRLPPTAHRPTGRPPHLPADTHHVAGCQEVPDTRGNKNPTDLSTHASAQGAKVPMGATVAFRSLLMRLLPASERAVRARI
jgi:hypothetical protein